MMRGIYYAARGMALESKKQEIISNNLANATTDGFKKDMVVVRSFHDRLKAVQRGRQNMSIGEMAQSPLMETVVTSFSKGSLEQTSRPLDFAMAGEGFFGVETSEGIRYTKNGRFQLDGEGFLVTAQGHWVLDADRNRLELLTKEILVDENGGIWNQQEEPQQLIGTLMAAVFDEEGLSHLHKQGSHLFVLEGDFEAVQGQGQVRQGMIEKSNVDLIKEMVDMMTVMRMYEANQKSLQAQDEMTGKSINEVGKLR